MCTIRINKSGPLNTSMRSMVNSQPKGPPQYYSLPDQITPKIRKPYTISKPREKWTCEEHRKFLEAIKLHGRSWRNVEEHIGTKNAAQIRSHAQKFFNKVARESTDRSVVSTIDIPAPRPKKKSTHPYPRKSINTLDKGYPLWIRLFNGQGSTSQEDSNSGKEKMAGSFLVQGQRHFSFSDSSVTGPISPVSISTSPKVTVENDRFNSDFAGTTNEVEQIEEKSQPTSPKCFQLFGKTITVADSETPRIDALKPMINEACSSSSSINNTTVGSSSVPKYQCSHGLLPFFNLASQMGTSASPLGSPILI